VTGRLAGGQLDADAGLVYDGDGRFFDPALGVYVQPDPFGGAPEAPASLNRYAAAGVSTLPTLGSVPTRNARRNYQDFVAQLRDTSANKTLGFVAEEHGIPAFLAQIGHHGFGKTARYVWRQNQKTARDFFVRLRISYPGISSKRWLSDQVFQPIISGRLYLNVNTGDLVDMRKTFLDPHIEEVPWRRLGGQLDEVAPSVGARLGRFALESLVSFGIDAAWQVGVDWNADMPVGHKIARAGIAGGVGMGAGWLTGAALGAIGVSAWYIVIPVAIVVGITVEESAKNLLFELFGVAHD
jgi:RHS repeat-associated protein